LRSGDLKQARRGAIVIEISVDDLIRLYKLASIGKLVGGLIHNLNGPLQNLGLDMEMAHYSLKDEAKWDKNMSEKIISRLKRMEEEHERINILIKTTATRTGDFSEMHNRLPDICGFIEDEFVHLHSNLYFKHNVQTEVIRPDDPPLISHLSKDSLAALAWFFQGLVEELERQRLVGLTVKIDTTGSGIKIVFSTSGGRLSEGFTKQLTSAMSSPDTAKSDDLDMGLFLVTVLFKADKITLKTEDGPSSSNLTIVIPG
jgi:hypothetical protein